MTMLQGKVALVTGASSGIGRATVLELARKGARVMAVARSRSLLEDLMKEVAALGGAGRCHVADVSIREEVAQAVAATIADFGRLDIVINNAGVEYLDPVSDIKEAELRHMLEVNCFGALYVAQSALPHLTDQGSGQIVMVSSPMVRLNFPFMGGYAASKAASMVLAETLRREVAQKGIRVMTCHPGHTDTAIASHMSADRFPAWYGKRTNTLHPDDVARRLVLGIIRGEEQVVIGGPVRFLLTLKQYMPSLADRIIRKITAAT